MTRPNTPARKNPDGSITVTMKRHCNGCGQPIGDVTEQEVQAGINGQPLPDVRSECPTCTPAAVVSPCGPAPDSCEDGGEPCDRHEREQAHADGDHELCGDECPVCSPELHAEDPVRLDRYAAAIYEGQNPGYAWPDAHPDDKRCARWDAGYVIAADHAHARGRAERAEQQLAAAHTLLTEYVTLADITHKYGAMGGHDCLAANHACAGCDLRDRARAALDAASQLDCPGETDPPTCNCPCQGCKHHCAAHQPDTCRTVDIDGETIRVRGAGEMTDETRGYVAEVVHAARRRYEAEHGPAGEHCDSPTPHTAHDWIHTNEDGPERRSCPGTPDGPSTPVTDGDR